MSAAKHTPEPWRLGKYHGPGSYAQAQETAGKFDVCVGTPDGVYILASTNVNFPEDAAANARRIVAAVNAVAGMPQNDLEELAKVEGGVMTLTVYADDMRKQQGQLLAVLEQTRATLERANNEGQINDTIWHSSTETLFDYIDAALASVKGGAA